MRRSTVCSTQYRLEKPWWLNVESAHSTRHNGSKPDQPARSILRPTRCAEIGVSNSRPIADVAPELGLVEQTLRNWVAAHRERLGGDAQELTVSERAKLKQLEKEVRELRMENEFLGKATAFFAKKSQ